MQLNRERIVRSALTAMLCATVVALSSNANFYLSSMVSAYLSLALASALIVLEIIRRSWIDLAWVLTAALLLAGIDYRLLHFHPYFMASFSFLGLAALAVLGTRAIWAVGENRKLLLYAFLPSVLFVASEWMATTLLDITEKLHPKAFDLFLYSFDCSLHIQISFLMGQAFYRWPWLRVACLLIYISLPLPLGLVYAAHLRRQQNKALQVMLAFLVTGPVGVLFYNMLPACGPVHLFRNLFPLYPLPFVQATMLEIKPILLKGARNAIPSLHMTWVLLVWWNSRGLPRWIRAIALTYLIFTAMATLGTGEHYFVDLVVAFPFSLMVQSACSYSLPLQNRERTSAFLFGTFATLIWFALLSFDVRLFWISPIIPWGMICATVAPSIVLWNRLLRSGDEQERRVEIQALAATASA